jgi:hypothetical protein
VGCARGRRGWEKVFEVVRNSCCFEDCGGALTLPGQPIVQIDLPNLCVLASARRESGIQYCLASRTTTISCSLLPGGPGLGRKQEEYRRITSPYVERVRTTAEPSTDSDGGSDD